MRLGKPYFHTCPDCGATLDPGERCDCKETQLSFLAPEERPRPKHREACLCAECTQKRLERAMGVKTQP